MLICETYHLHSSLYWTTFLPMHQYLLDNSSHRVLCTTSIRVSSGSSRELSSETLITDKFTTIYLSCLLSHPNSFVSFSSRISFLRKQHYMHPSNKLPVLRFNRVWKWTNIISYIYVWLWVMAILCFEWITTLHVIKYKLKIRNRLWNTAAVTQETLQNSSLGKICVSFRVKEK